VNMKDINKRLIKVLMSQQSVDSNEIATRLALIAPELFIDLIETPDEKLDNIKVTVTYADVRARSFHARIGNELVSGNKVAAVKLTRELTGWGLKEAKDNCDAVEIMMARNPSMYRDLAHPPSHAWLGMLPDHNEDFVDGVLELQRKEDDWGLR